MGKIIGIGLRNNKPCVAVFEGNEPVVIANSEGKVLHLLSLASLKAASVRWVTPKRQAITKPREDRLLY